MHIILCPNLFMFVILCKLLISVSSMIFIFIVFYQREKTVLHNQYILLLLYIVFIALQQWFPIWGNSPLGGVPNLGEFPLRGEFGHFRGGREFGF